MHDIGKHMHGIPHTIQPQAAERTFGIKSKRQYETATVDSLCPLQSHTSARSAVRNSTDLLILAKSKQGTMQAQHSSDATDTPQQPHNPVSHSTAGVSTSYMLETSCGRKCSSSCMSTSCVLPRFNEKKSVFTTVYDYTCTPLTVYDYTCTPLTVNDYTCTPLNMTYIHYWPLEVHWGCSLHTILTLSFYLIKTTINTCVRGVLIHRHPLVMGLLLTSKNE